ncbi:isocitrate lyase/phosphoenolpyruvate mutase family protein [Streptomyces spirodelae]|uniref:Isocitrate lyase/phosphoenolpyruvate mutase family protein n=1 Tax=Streptomyces spirodelae TaxID=2812904 RepID=A0ABS3WU94_9ACTN|nr:isocitrate lyase/phosphoenolpyruvate mutase family protein [Streptomyces spirodelae]MBO8186674.1 isocitrate lyase/phosphoenolpyruvate mutase family protein [Streptomyces spirodelae]
MTRTVHEFDRYEDVRAALADPHLVPELPAAAEGWREGASMAWLRDSVSRFSSGEAHVRRRALVEAELRRVDPAALRRAVAEEPGASGQDVRRQVVRALAGELGLREPGAVAEAVSVVAGVYFGGTDAAADAAVAQLVELLGDAPLGEHEPSRGEGGLEVTAARICLLVQACDATASLVRHAAAADDGARPVEELLAETLRRDPPVRVLRRVAARATRVAGRELAEGDVVLLDVATASREEGAGGEESGGRGGAAHGGGSAGFHEATVPLAFGARPRECPGREHASALAAGLLRPVRSTRFAGLHHREVPLLLPNAWDHASAAALVAEGFEAVGTTSLGVAAAAGLPDGAAATADSTVELARQLGRAGLLFTVDAESGFSDDPVRVAELARRLWAAGAAGINLEDGREDGTLAAVESHVAKVEAIKAAVPELFLNARTDTYWSGCRQDETEDRLLAYQEAGADGVFVPGLSDPERIGALADCLDVPLNILYTPTGPTVAELAVLGVRRVSLGSLLYRTALGAAVSAARAVREGRDPTPATGGVPSYAQVQALCSGVGALEDIGTVGT